jgi:hypothetical protein
MAVPRQNPVKSLVPSGENVNLRGIYNWDGDNLRTCSADDQGDRPTEFRTVPGSKNRIRVWNRKK